MPYLSNFHGSTEYSEKTVRRIGLYLLMAVAIAMAMAMAAAYEVTAGYRNASSMRLVFFFPIDMLDGLRDGGGRNSSSEFSLSHHRGVMHGWSHEVAEAAEAATAAKRRQNFASLHCGHADVTSNSSTVGGHEHASVTREQEPDLRDTSRTNKIRRSCTPDIPRIRSWGRH